MMASHGIPARYTGKPGKQSVTIQTQWMERNLQNPPGPFQDVSAFALGMSHVWLQKTRMYRLLFTRFWGYTQAPRFLDYVLLIC